MKKNILLVLMLFILSLIPFSISSAQSDQTGLTISPINNEINLDPGQSYQGKIKVTNINQQIVNIAITSEDFGAQDESGQPRVFKEEEISNYSLKNWLEISANFIQLLPKSFQEITYTITAPINAEPGGHYGVILFSPVQALDNSTDDSIINLGSQIGSLILVNVSGKSMIQAAITEFTTKHQQIAYFNNSADFITRIKNNGTVHFKPQGFITIYDVSNKEVANIEFNQDKGNVLPDQIRKFENQWQFGKHWGVFKAKLNLIYGENQNLQAETTFYIIPWIEISIGFVVLIILFWLAKNLQWKKR